MSLWLIGVQGSAMQEVVVLTGDWPVFLVALLRAGRQACPQARPPRPPAGRRGVWKVAWLNLW